MIAKTKTLVTVAAAALTLGAGIGVATLASADPTTTPSPGATASGAPDSPPGPGRHGGPGRGLHNTDLAKELAGKLGVTEAKVTEALQAVHAEHEPPARPTPGAAKPDPAARDAELANALATKLGVDEAKVSTALDEIRAAHEAERRQALKDRLAAAVKAGTLTQAEADAVQKAMDTGVIPGGR